MSEGIDYGGSSWASIVTAAIAAAAAVTIARCLYTAIARSLYANTTQQVPSDGHEETKEVRWKKPETGWVKLNVDGSRREHQEPSTGCGGVIRDEWGTWLLGFAKKLDPDYEVHETELQAILKGLELVASEMNVEKLVVESDSKPALSMVKSGLGCKYQRPEYDVVQDIVRLLSDPRCQARLDYVPKTANRVANRLAKHARKQMSSHELRKYRHPPESDDVYDCARLFLEDNGQGV